jgi:hypothetical protein
MRRSPTRSEFRQPREIHTSTHPHDRIRSISRFSHPLMLTQPTVLKIRRLKILYPPAIGIPSGSHR